MLARLIGKSLAERSKRTVSFENIHGSNGISGSAKAAAAAPDGRTVLIAASAHYINPSIYRSLPFDPLRDFAPVSLIAAVSNVLAVHPSLPVSSCGELIAWAKQRPGALGYASGGHGSPSHLAGELFKVMARRRPRARAVSRPCRSRGSALDRARSPTDVRCGNDCASPSGVRTMACHCGYHSESLRRTSRRAYTGRIGSSWLRSGPVDWPACSGGYARVGCRGVGRADREHRENT